jgi:hypothetical protein
MLRPAVLVELGCAGLLAVLVWLAYAPSLKHAPRADQWCFLVDTLDDHTFLDTLRHSYSYNRTRRIAPGDTDLFRPVLFALLSAEKVFFEGDLGAAQAAGIVLHGVVCGLLVVLLRQITGLNGKDDSGRSLVTTLLPYAVAALFALNPGVQELVIWTHLHGYLLFLVLLLGSVALLVRHASGSAAGTWRSPSLWGSWMLALFAAFTYELGQVYAVLAGLVLAAAVVNRAGRVRAAGLLTMFVVISVAYQGANAIDLRSHTGEFEPENNRRRVVEEAIGPATVEHSARFGVYTVVQPFFPTVPEHTFTGGRLHIAESLWTRHGRRNLGPAAVISALVFALAVGLALAGLTRIGRPEHRLRLLVLSLFAALFAVYAGMNVLGRMNLRPVPEILASNSYYTYPALLFALLACFTAWSAADLPAVWAVNARGVLLAGLVVLAVLGAEHVRRVNQDVTTCLAEVAKPIRTVNTFVRHHRHEPDFSFTIDHAASDRIIPVYGIPVTDVMFGRWMTAPSPKYRIAYRNGSVVVLSPAAGRGDP